MADRNAVNDWVDVPAQPQNVPIAPVYQSVGDDWVDEDKVKALHNADDPGSVLLFRDKATGMPVYGVPPAAGQQPKPRELMTDQEKRSRPDIRGNPKTGLPFEMPAPGEGGILERFLDAPYTGTKQAIEGVEQIAGAPGITSRETGAGIQHVIGGALEAASPLLPGAFAGAPQATALMLGAGSAADIGTNSILQWAGVSPEWSGAWGAMAGLLGAGFTFRRMQALARLPYLRERNILNAKLEEIFAKAKDANLTEMDRGRLQAQSTALLDAIAQAEQGPNGYFLPQLNFRDLLPDKEIKLFPGLFQNPNQAEAEAYNYLRGQGVAPNAGAATGSTFVRGAHHLTGMTPAGAVMDVGARKQTIGALRDTATRLVSEAMPKDGKASEFYSEYERFANEAPAVEVPLRVDKDGSWIKGNVKIPVDIRDLKIELQPLFEKMEFMPMAERSASHAYSALKVLLGSDDFIPGPTAEWGLSQFKKAARLEQGGISEGLAKRIIPHLQAVIDGATESHAGDEALAALQKGRAAAAKEAGGDWLIEQFKKAQQEGGFGHEKALWNSWTNLTDTAKRSMYTPDQIAELNKFFLGLKMYAENPNPSGTALVGAIMAQGGYALHGGVIDPSFWLGQLSATAIAKLLRSDAGIKLLTDGLKIPRNTERGRFIENKLKRILGENPDGNPPEPGGTPNGNPPKPGGSPTGGSTEGPSTPDIETLKREASQIDTGGNPVGTQAAADYVARKKLRNLAKEAFERERGNPSEPSGGPGNPTWRNRAREAFEKLKDEEGSVELPGGAGSKPEIGPRGPIFREFYHDAAGAVEKLKKARAGEAPGALHHPEIGDIDLIWGRPGNPAKNFKDGFGLSHILAKHEEMRDQVGQLGDIIKNLSIVPEGRRGADEIRLENERYRAIVSRVWQPGKNQPRTPKTWLLTAFEPKK